jgi:hypothetical protein
VNNRWLMTAHTIDPNESKIQIWIHKEWQHSTYAKIRTFLHKNHNFLFIGRWVNIFVDIQSCFKDFWKRYCKQNYLHTQSRMSSIEMWKKKDQISSLTTDAAYVGVCMYFQNDQFHFIFHYFFLFSFSLSPSVPMLPFLSLFLLLFLFLLTYV